METLTNLKSVEEPSINVKLHFEKIHTCLSPRPHDHSECWMCYKRYCLVIYPPQKVPQAELDKHRSIKKYQCDMCHKRFTKLKDLKSGDHGKRRKKGFRMEELNCNDSFRYVTLSGQRVIRHLQHFYKYGVDTATGRRNFESCKKRAKQELIEIEKKEGKSLYWCTPNPPAKRYSTISRVPTDTALFQYSQCNSNKIKKNEIEKEEMPIHPLNQYSRYHWNKNQKSEIEKEEKVDATEENVSKRKRDHSELSDDEESYKKLRM